MLLRSLTRVTLWCMLLLTMCHVAQFEQCYNSDNWHAKKKVDRPFVVPGKKCVQRGVFTMKRGKQTLSSACNVATQSMQSVSSVKMNSFLVCYFCKAKTHSVSRCPLLQCVRCHEYGHIATHCKKTLPDK